MNLAATLTALAVLIGAVASAASTDKMPARIAFGLAAIMSLVALVIQYRAARPYVYAFTPSDWEDNSTNEVSIVVPARRHGKGTAASGRVEQATERGYEVVLTSIETRANGDVVTLVNKAASNFSGRIVIS